MNAALRHLSVRLWMTAFISAMSCIFVLPWWQRVLGLEWLIFPVIGIMMGCFAGFGWGMNRIGMGFLNRHVDEAASWERAGMMTEAQAAFQKAMDTFDSFWLSPLLRERRLKWFSGRMARFHLSHHSKSALARARIPIHLKQFPEDGDVATSWLEQLLTYEVHLPLEHETADIISRCQTRYPRVEQLLMQFFMSNGRIDFDAMQTYRRVWKNQQPLPGEMLQGLSHLLRREHILDHWTLDVYLKAYEGGDREAIAGIAAGVQWLPVTEENAVFFSIAEKIIADLGAQHTVDVDARFKPARVQVSARKKMVFNKYHRPGNRPQFNRFLEKGKVGRDWFLRIFSMRRTLTAMVLIMMIVLTVSGVRFFKNRSATEPDIPPPVTVPEKVAVTDPFTIQVAAYLNAEDAQRFVNNLIQSELDAFWTHEKSTNRTWYQVKVSHFARREDAQKYGQELKSKGLIDDFYVANYDHQKRMTSSSDQ